MSLAVPAPFTSDARSIVTLRERVAGAVITPDEPAYEEARLVWNRAFEMRPAVIVEAEHAEDVVAAVRFAADVGLGVSVQATGHGLSREADDALLVLTRRMSGVTVDADAATARVEAGAPWLPVLEQAQRHGLAPLLGSSPHVGAVGYTLGGGMGWLARKHGLSSGAVRALEVVTADGQLRRVTADDEGELFWALRGAGVGSFGIVTAMEIDLFPVSQVYGGNLLYPIEQAAEVFARFRTWVQDLPDEFTTAVAIMHYPPLDVIPEPIRGRSFAIVRGCWCGDLEQGEELVRSWRDWREPELDLFGPMPFTEVAEISQDPVDPLPALATTDSLPDLTAAASDVLIRASMPDGSGPPALMFTEVRHCGGALARADDLIGGSAYRDARFVTHIVGLVDPDAPARVVEHARALHDALEGHRTRHAYLNFLDAEDRRERAAEACTPDEWARLRAIKGAVDPDGRLGYGLL